MRRNASPPRQLRHFLSILVKGKAGLGTTSVINGDSIAVCLGGDLPSSAPPHPQAGWGLLSLARRSGCLMADRGSGCHSNRSPDGLLGLDRLQHRNRGRKQWLVLVAPVGAWSAHFPAESQTAPSADAKASGRSEEKTLRRLCGEPQVQFGDGREPTACSCMCTLVHGMQRTDRIAPWIGLCQGCVLSPRWVLKNVFAELAPRWRAKGSGILHGRASAPSRCMGRRYTCLRQEFDRLDALVRELHKAAARHTGVCVSPSAREPRSDGPTTGRRRYPRGAPRWAPRTSFRRTSAQGC